MPLPLVRPLPWREPYGAAQLLASHWGRDGLVLLDTHPTAWGENKPSHQQDGSRHWSFLGTAPIRQLRCQSWPSWEHGSPAHGDDPFTLLRQALPEQGTWAHPTVPPFMGGWMGWLSYEAGAWLERHPPWQRPDQPLLWAGLHDPLLCFDLLNRQVLAISHGFTGEGWDRSAALAAQRQETLLALWAGPAPPKAKGPEPQGTWVWRTSAPEFAQQVAQLRERIGAGDIFQANLSCCREAILPKPPDPLRLYGRLRQGSPAPFAGLVICGEHALLSASPERFLHVGGDGWVETRPIKGTRPRHQDPVQDAALAVELVTSSKDRAENIMIVDLLRNDLGRVCRPGTITVPTLAGLEGYQQVHHLTSVITGQLRADCDALDLLRSAWPGGSITGAPKVRSCQRLAELEPLPRGPYCGSLFWLGLDGSLDSNIIIRTVIQKGCRLRAHAGCGIVYDSDPGEETREMGLKMAPLLRLLQPVP